MVIDDLSRESRYAVFIKNVLNMHLSIFLRIATALTPGGASSTVKECYDLYKPAKIQTPLSKLDLMGIVKVMQ